MREVGVAAVCLALLAGAEGATYFAVGMAPELLLFEEVPIVISSIPPSRESPEGPAKAGPDRLGEPVHRLAPRDGGSSGTEVR